MLIGCSQNKEIVKTEYIYSTKIVKCELPDVEPIKPPEYLNPLTVNDLGIKFRESLIKIDLLNKKLIAVKEVCGTKIK